MANIILTKDFSVKEDQNGKGAGHSTYYFPDGSIVASDSFVDTETQTGGHVVGKIQIVSGNGAYQGATGGGSLTGIGATKAAQGRGALQHRIGRDDTGNLTREPSRGRLHSPPRWASQKGARPGVAPSCAGRLHTVPQTSCLPLRKQGDGPGRRSGPALEAPDLIL
jgi:hypothetical protein